jgi:ABC-2 type transport system ATP-binding protein
LQEVEAVCSRVLILNEGRIAAQGTPEEIAHNMKAASRGSRDTWELYLKGSPPDQNFARDLPMETEELSVEVRESGMIRLCFVISGSEDHSVDGESIFDWAVGHGCKIIGMSRKKLSLEDIFVKLTGEQHSNGREKE